MSTPSSNLDFNIGANGVSDVAPAWKHELNERLQETRIRRTRRLAEQASLPTMEEFHEKSPAAKSRASQLAAKVAERYAKAPSYSDVIAAEARAAAVAAAAALSAVREAHHATQALLAGLETETQETAPSSIAQSISTPAEYDVRPERDQARTLAAASRDGGPRSAFDAPCAVAELPEAVALGAAFHEAMVLPAQPLPVNLIEFPRELVAARKARPRLAEGPLRDSYEETSHGSQLRIFEVESEAISKEVKIAPSPEWSSIRLDSKPAASVVEEASSSLLVTQLNAAPLEDRLMAGIFDLALILLAFVLFVLVFAACTVHPPTGRPALIAAGSALAGLFLLYQFMFFRFTEGTPGMRYAKIALCTFDDENPARKDMRRRILFLMLSAAPLCLGFAWAWFDADRLGWHDRLTRMYQRSYRD